MEVGCIFSMCTIQNKTIQVKHNTKSDANTNKTKYHIKVAVNDFLVTGLT